MTPDQPATAQPRLMEAIVAATRAAAGKPGELKAEDYSASLPLAVLTCIDPRLNRRIPEALAIPEEQFVWLRNAGNIITSSLSSTMRSLALAVLVKGAKEIAVVGHTDCQVGKATLLQLTDRLKGLGIERSQLPENLVEFFGMFASERQNVLKAVEHIRSSPLIGPKMPVHGLLLDVQTGKLEWVVNGYQALETVSSQFTSAIKKAEAFTNQLGDLPDFQIGDIKFPGAKIGEAATKADELLHKIEEKVEQVESKVQSIKESVAGQRPSPVAAPTTPAGLGRKIDPARRYKIIGSDRKVYGPIPGKTVIQWLVDDRIDGETPVQMEGTTSWQALGTLPDVTHAYKGKPPSLPTTWQELAKRK